jgi:hypothetical protein
MLPTQDGLGSLVHVDNFTAFVETALRANAMLHARLLAIRANRSLRRLQGIVGAALTAACF